MNWIKLVVKIFSLTIYCVSIVSKAITCRGFDGKYTLSGSKMLFMGGTAFVGGGILEWVIWLANPFYLGAIFIAKTNKNRKILLIIATVVIIL